MRYELWDLDTGNLAGDYPTEAAALAAVSRAVHEQGPAALAGYALLRDDGEHDPVVIAADANLAMRAERQQATAPAH